MCIFVFMITKAFLLFYFLICLTPLLSCGTKDCKEENGFCWKDSKNEAAEKKLVIVDKPDMGDEQPSGYEWFSQGKTNGDLITQLVTYGVIKSKRVEDVMRIVDRGHYSSKSPYEDSPQTIGYRATISAPHMHAHALEILRNNLQEGSKVLDVGSGSGYLAACFAEMVGPSGKVVGIEHIDELVELSKKNIQKGNNNLLQNGRLVIVVGDGRKGYQSEAPFDAIHVGAAAVEVPDALLIQLKPGGKLFIPVGPTNNQWLELYEKKEDGTVERKKLYGVRYVPLTSKDQQWPTRT